MGSHFQIGGVFGGELFAQSQSPFMGLQGWTILTQERLDVPDAKIGDRLRLARLGIGVVFMGQLLVKAEHLGQHVAVFPHPECSARATLFRRRRKSLYQTPPPESVFAVPPRRRGRPLPLPRATAEFPKHAPGSPRTPPPHPPRRPRPQNAGVSASLLNKSPP